MVLTHEQRKALLNVWRRESPVIRGCNATTLSYREFRRTVQGGPGCIMVKWAGMWLGIEPDGYTHS